MWHAEYKRELKAYWEEEFRVKKESNTFAMLVRSRTALLQGSDSIVKEVAFTFCR